MHVAAVKLLYCVSGRRLLPCTAFIVITMAVGYGLDFSFLDGAGHVDADFYGLSPCVSLLPGLTPELVLIIAMTLNIIFASIGSIACGIVIVQYTFFGFTRTTNAKLLVCLSLVILSYSLVIIVSSVLILAGIEGSNFFLCYGVRLTLLFLFLMSFMWYLSYVTLRGKSRFSERR